MKKLISIVSTMMFVSISAAMAANEPHGNSPGFINGPLDSVSFEPVDASHGDNVVFEIGGVTLEDSAWVKVLCYQKRDLVYYGMASYYDNLDWQSRVFNLTNNAKIDILGLIPWNGEAALCSAELLVLWGKNHKVVDKIEFQVAA